MDSQFNLAKFSFAKVTLYIIEIFNWWVTDSALDISNPLTPIITVSAIENSHFVDREDHFERVYDCACRSFKVFFLFRLDKYTD